MIRSLLIVGVLFVYTADTFANDGCCCPECGTKTCIAKPVTKKVKKTVFNVEKKDICIPKFRFPWQMKKNTAGSAGCDASCDSSNGACGSSECGCAPKCGRVITVKVLKKKSIECEKCGYEWEITTVESVPCDSCQTGFGLGGLGLRGRASANCDSSAACDSSYFQGSNVQTTPSPTKQGAPANSVLKQMDKLPAVPPAVPKTNATNAVPITPTPTK